MFGDGPQKNVQSTTSFGVVWYQHEWHGSLELLYSLLTMDISTLIYEIFSHEQEAS